MSRPDAETVSMPRSPLTATALDVSDHRRAVEPGVVAVETHGPLAAVFG